MPESLFAQLRQVGIDEELASQVSASLDPAYNATKKDLLVMQEAMLQIQLQMERNQQQAELSFQSLKSDIKDVRSELKADIKDVRSELKADIKDVRSELRTEIHTTINRQYLVTFGSALLTIASVLAVNWYFHI